jgi:uncharacterized protein YbcV (DUF1398 family)
VKSGADFPAYIQDIKKSGVTQYETFEVNAEQFKIDLKAHQQGLTDYDSFIRSCAKFGIAKWIVRINEMTCTYYDKTGTKILVEEIPH